MIKSSVAAGSIFHRQVLLAFTQQQFTANT